MLYSTSGAKQKRIQGQTLTVICIIASVLLSSFAPLSVLAASPQTSVSLPLQTTVNTGVKATAERNVESAAAAPIASSANSPKSRVVSFATLGVMDN